MLLITSIDIKSGRRKLPPPPPQEPKSGLGRLILGFDITHN